MAYHYKGMLIARCDDNMAMFDVCLCGLGSLTVYAPVCGTATNTCSLLFNTSTDDPPLPKYLMDIKIIRDNQSIMITNMRQAELSSHGL
jgi:hypothetical protein